MNNLEHSMKKVAAVLTGRGADEIPDHLEDICSFIAENYSGGGQESVTVDTLGGATDVGKSLMKAESKETAREAIGAGEPYSLPMATEQAAGGVKKAAAVSFTTDSATAETCATAIEQLISSLKTAGIMA